MPGSFLPAGPAGQCRYLRSSVDTGAWHTADLAAGGDGGHMLGTSGVPIPATVPAPHSRRQRAAQVATISVVDAPSAEEDRSTGLWSMTLHGLVSRVDAVQVLAALDKCLAECPAAIVMDLRRAEF